jgi:hypothetical protein
MVTFSDIRNKREEILAIARAHGADNVRVFGSFVHGSATEGSDLDLLVTMAPGSSLLDRIAIMQDLEELLRIKVDVVNEKALHESIRQSVLEQGVPL